MVQRDEVPKEVTDIDAYYNFLKALENSKPAYPETPFGATKTAELDIQFALDSSFGLTEERYGWYSNEVLFDNSLFTEANGKIRLETGAVGTDRCRLRTAYPGQYLPHSVAEPGCGVEIPIEYMDYSGEWPTLTHGEISADVAQWSDDTQSAQNSHGISFESDGIYHQVRSGNQDVHFVPQSEWNIDPMDGTGPSGRVFRPERGYVYVFQYSWYGEGSYILTMYDPATDDTLPVDTYIPDEPAKPAVESPNMPVQVAIENKGTAQPLTAIVGGMQFATYGFRPPGDTSRATTETRITSGNYINTPVTLVDNAVDPFAEPGKPLISVRRQDDNLNARKGLDLRISDAYLSAGSNCYVFVFDEFDDATALTGQSWHTPHSRNNPSESNVDVDTSATDYTPSANAALRGMLYIDSANKSTRTITGEVSNQIPLEATTVFTVALAPGSNSTDARPFKMRVFEAY